MSSSRKARHNLLSVGLAIHDRGVEIVRWYVAIPVFLLQFLTTLLSGQYRDFVHDIALALTEQHRNSPVLPQHADLIPNRILFDNAPEFPLVLGTANMSDCVLNSFAAVRVHLIDDVVHGWLTRPLMSRHTIGTPMKTTAHAH